MKGGVIKGAFVMISLVILMWVIFTVSGSLSVFGSKAFFEVAGKTLGKAFGIG